MTAPAAPARERRAVFFLVRATAAWLAHPPAQRAARVDAILRPILARRAGVSLRFFDAEAYSATTSDVLLWEYDDERTYRAVVEDLRETAFWGTYFEIREIVPCVEDDFARHYGVPALSAASAVTGAG